MARQGGWLAGGDLRMPFDQIRRLGDDGPPMRQEQREPQPLGLNAKKWVSQSFPGRHTFRCLRLPLIKDRGVLDWVVLRI